MAAEVKTGHGMEVSFSGRDDLGRTWYFDVSGAFTSTRAGLRRAETLWKALGKAAVLHASHPDIPLVLITTDAPVAGSAGDQALTALRRRPALGRFRGCLRRHRDGVGRRPGPPGPLRVQRTWRLRDDPCGRNAVRMPDDRTTVTELATALGMLPYGDVRTALAARPAELAVGETTWARLAALYDAGTMADEFATAYRQWSGLPGGTRRAAGADGPG